MSFSEINNARYSSHFYLSNCDSINKNVFNNLCYRPKVKKIFLEFSPNDLDLTEDSFQTFTNGGDHQIESFLLLYSTRLHKPLVSLSCSALSKKDLGNYSLKVVISNEEDMYIFLLVFFIENLSELVDKNSSVYCIEKELQSGGLLCNRKFALNYSLAVGSFFDLEDFSTKSSFDSKLRKSKLKVRFLFEAYRSKDLGLSKESVRNIPLFWMS